MGAPRSRRRWLWLLLPLLLGGAWFGVRALLEPERLGAWLLREAEAATGLRFAVAAPPRIGLWPDLHLAFDGLQAHAPDSGATLLRIAQLEAVLPWSALRADHVELRSLRLQSPELELPALRTWLAARSDDGPPAPLRLPALHAALEVQDGRLRDSAFRIERIALQLDGLRAGAPSILTLQGEWIGADGARPIALRLSGTPREERGALALETLHLQLDAPLRLALRGRAEGQPGRLSFELTGELPLWPASWPPSPLAPPDAPAAHSLALGYEGDAGLHGRVRLRLASGDESLDADLVAHDLLAWWRDPHRPLLPPARGEARASRLRVGGSEWHGVKLRLEDAPANGAPPDGAR